MIAESQTVSLSIGGRVWYGIVLYVALYQHSVKQEAPPAAIVRRHARPGPCSHLMCGHKLVGVPLLAALQSHQKKSGRLPQILCCSAWCI